MNKLWRVATYEYGRNVFKKSFLIMLLSLPLLIVFSISFGLLMESRGNNIHTVGLVDQAGVLQSALISPAALSGQPVEFILFDSADTAQEVLVAGAIQVYFILPEHYLATRQVEVVYTQEPGGDVWQQFYVILRGSLLSGHPAQVVQRAASATNFMVRSVDGSRQVPVGSGPTFGLLMPLFIAVGVLASLLMSSGYTTNAVADEKENRTVEVLVTTISPLQLIGGKILGIAATSLTAMAVWAAMVTIGIVIASQAGVSWFNNLSLDWHPIATTFAIAIPAYVLVIALMTAIGAMVTTTQEGQSVSSIFFIFHLLPMYISVSFLTNPHSSLAVLLSVLPFTSLMTVAMRNLFTIVPAWQVGASVVVQVLCAWGAIWLASRAFRIGMLQYGQRLRLRSLFKRG